VPIPYRDADDLDELGTAAFLKIAGDKPDGSGYVGALFVINARGEPLEFSYNRVETPHTFLWRKDDIRRHATRKLVISLLSICPKIPRLILCLAEEIGSEVFCQDIEVSVPVCRIAPAMRATPYSASEVQDVVEVPEPLHVFWYPAKPSDDSVELRLVRELASRGLLIEPFDRAGVGLAEVYQMEQRETT